MAPAFKRRKVVNADRPDELTFDPAARSEYLTGFHKRKEARKEAAREAAIQRDKDERVRERKQLREQRKEDLEKHVAAVNDELRKQNTFVHGGSLEEEGYSDAFEDNCEPFTKEPELEQLPEDEEYVDEDKYTTVTVEAMEETDDTDSAVALRKQPAPVEGMDDKGKTGSKKRPRTEDRNPKAKVKKKKFRYETKAERAVTRQKQKSKNRVAAKARRQD